MKVNLTKDKALEGIYIYGFLPALFTLATFEEKEQYENCRALKYALDEIALDRGLSSETTKENLSENEGDYTQRMQRQVFSRAKHA